mgnify:CR=1 FL=1
MTGHLLNETERTLLEEYYKTASGLQQRRSHLILLYDDGYLTHQAAEQAGFSRSQARFWKHQFLMDGMAIFPDLLTMDLKEELLQSPVDISTGIEITEQNQALPNPSVPEQMPFPAAIKRPGVKPGDTLAEAGRKTWCYLFSEMIQKEDPTRAGDDIEALHDMRVATRRMRSAFDVFDVAFKPKIVRRYLKGLRLAGRALGKVRDMDVLLEKLERYISTLDAGRKDGLIPLLDAWRQERESGRQALIAFLDGDAYLQFKQEFNHFVQTPGEGVQVFSQALPRAILVCEVVPTMIYTRLGSVRAYHGILSNATDTQLHALRIEFKKLRYTVEYFREVLGVEASQVITDLKRIQDHLGDFHDTVVACGLVTTFLSEWEDKQLTRPLVERQNPEPIVTYLAYLHAERHRLLITLPEAWNHFSQPEFRENLAKSIAVL